MPRSVGDVIRYPVPFGGIGWVALFAAMFIMAFAVYTYGEAQDNDMWWLFATGREILENGIPYVNPFDIYGDQAIVIQQWIPCVLAYVAYNTFGFVGIGLVVMLLTLAVAASVIALAKVCLEEDGWLPIGAAIAATMLGVAIAYLSIRPQAWSMLAFLWILNVMERYRRGASPKVLIWLPVIVAIHANFHLSMMPFDLFIVACYIVPAFHRLNISSTLDSYRRLLLLPALAAMALAACINPYGLDGALYLINSYDAASYGDYIVEMGATQTTSYYGLMLLVFVIFGGIAIGRNGLKNIDVPLTLLFLVTVVLSFQHVRNVWLAAIFATALLLSSLRDVKPVPSSAFLKDSMVKLLAGIFGCVLLLTAGIITQTENLVEEPSDSRSTPVAATDYLDDLFKLSERRDISVFTHFNAGGFIEWHGYRVSMDARPELWNSRIAKTGKDRYIEYIDMSQEKKTPAEYMEGKEFDYLIINTDTALYKYLLGDMRYSLVVRGEGYVLFESQSQNLS